MFIDLSELSVDIRPYVIPITLFYQ